MSKRNRITVHGVDWLHGRATDPDPWERIWSAELCGYTATLEYRRADYEAWEDPGWYYYSPRTYGRYLARRRDDALIEATHALFKESAQAAQEAQS